jgi:hypothetical protein
MANTLHDKRWINRPPNTTGVHVFDLTADTDTSPKSTPKTTTSRQAS